MSNTQNLVEALGYEAKKASFTLAQLSSIKKNYALEKITRALEQNHNYIINANKEDVALAKDHNISKTMLDRLVLNDSRLNSMIESVNQVKNLPDPIGKLITAKKLPNEIKLKKIRVPIGVIGVIFESRPNVITDIVSLCIKSGNAVILKGGKEAQHTNRALFKTIKEALLIADFPAGAIGLIDVIDREAVKILCGMKEYIDLIIPRGGEGLIETVLSYAKVPVIKNYKGVCHVYVDAYADIDMAINICYNAKYQKPSVCNAVETILIHKDIANIFLPKLYEKFSQASIEMRGCQKTKEVINNIKDARETDWHEEYLDLIIAIKIVDDYKEAIEHINHFGSHHSDAIITKDRLAQEAFAKMVDSAVVYINASTRFTDGAQFGLGAEIGISTDKFHARGPMGLLELTSYKYLAIGNGQIR